MSSNDTKSGAKHDSDALPMATPRHHKPPSANELRPTPMQGQVAESSPTGAPASDRSASAGTASQGPEKATEAAPNVPTSAVGASTVDPRELEEAVIEQLKTCYDPEIPIDIYELGLIYKVKATSEGDVAIEMTLTSPACPVAGTLPGEVEQLARATPGVRNVSLDLVFDPPWDQEMMSEAAKLTLGFM